jgi:flavodoxin
MKDMNSGQKDSLVVYFSHSGNTKVIAEMIQKATGGDIFEIKTIKTYPEDYDAVVAEAKQESQSGYMPELKTKIENFRQYSLVFIGYPIWWYTFPAPVKAFLTGYDFSGKAIAPFCTHEGSGLSKSPEDFAKFCPKSEVLPGLAIRGGSVDSAQSKVSAWLQAIKIRK